MISLDIKNNQIAVSVMGQFTLDDYREFEQAVCYGIQFQGTVDLLFDLRDMLSYSLDVAWEELKFSREHKNDFGRIAILTDDQWMAWSMWLNRSFMSAEIRLFDDLEMAQAWVAGGDLPLTAG
ncbi:MAG TPA: STAS/SEC14 domain-containing protein [Thiobacillus sp.]|nr:MAG: STAS/SEC14 domain-containing protein [Hydrogenophilales bacterium 28-61-11]OYZ56897.1 MAG: STAS/SEC14 domain-containing protein [Hydrogenophilales bacterium 16-61-112]OZA47930.1 MAG: STAS/SEC14 domain-containing protein [Hydrogenophilales bacterium 17-61-76]HQT30974.1 STAS/SEC14 domain-containing protein [Thiobacillus sp.]HQT69073.1 STAS/SEC14 domain-containing protein [Thiobacillus sp.]